MCIHFSTARKIIVKKYLHSILYKSNVYIYMYDMYIHKYTIDIQKIKLTAYACILIECHVPLTRVQ